MEADQDSPSEELGKPESTSLQKLRISQNPGPLGHRKPSHDSQGSSNGTQPPLNTWHGPGLTSASSLCLSPTGAPNSDTAMEDAEWQPTDQSAQHKDQAVHAEKTHVPEVLHPCQSCGWSSMRNERVYMCQDCAKALPWQIQTGTSQDQSVPSISPAGDDSNYSDLQVHINNEIHRLLGPSLAGGNNLGIQPPATPHQLPRAHKSKSLRWIQDAARRSTDGPAPLDAEAPEARTAVDRSAVPDRRQTESPFANK